MKICLKRNKYIRIIFFPYKLFRNKFQIFNEKLKNFLLKHSLWERFVSRYNKFKGYCFLKTEAINIDVSSICNLSCVMCPDLYSDKEKGCISLADFKLIADSASLAEWKHVHFCPEKGEVFLNKNFFSMLDYIDKSEFFSFSITTNFIPLKPDDILKLFSFNKLRLLTISIYGYDITTFQAITQKTEKQFLRLFENLKALRQLCSEMERNFRIRFKWWIGEKQIYSRSADEFKSFIVDFSKEIDSLKIMEFASNRGGEINNESICQTGIKIRRPNSPKTRYGPCKDLFGGVIVRVNKKVTTCRCSDRFGLLYLGRVDQAPLNFIVSGRNPLFFDLITEQENGFFRPPCDKCSEYQSIYSPGGHPVRKNALNKKFHLE